MVRQAESRHHSGNGPGGAGRRNREPQSRFPYEEIPHFPALDGEVARGPIRVRHALAGKSVVAMEGRFHFYEGYSLQQITLPVRVMKALGCEVLIVSNACGGMNPQYGKGDLMLIEDHINLIGDNPLIGKNDDRLGPAFPGYVLALRSRADQAAQNRPGRKDHLPQGRVRRGLGPQPGDAGGISLPARIGADVVGMSTVPEVIVAVHAGLRSLGISVITDVCLPDALQPVSLEEILETAAVAEKKLRTLVRRVVAQI